MPVPSEPAEDLPAEAVTQLNEGLKVCKKVVSEYRVALSGKRSSSEPVQIKADPPIQRD